MGNKGWFSEEPISFVAVIITVIVNLIAFFINPPAWYIIDIVSLFLYYVIVLCIARVRIIGDNDFNTTKELHFFDWYSHLRFWSFWWWFNPLFWIYALYKYTTDKTESFVEDRFKLEIYINGFLQVVYLIIITISFIIPYFIR